MKNDSSIKHEAPLVSVCVITYNQEKYIRQCLDSILMQETNFSFELILQDDCSTDGSRKICQEYVDKYPNIIIPIFHDENQYSKGCMPYIPLWKIARGKYIASCEGDDFWNEKTKLAQQVDLLESSPPGIAGCFHDSYTLYPDNRQVPRIGERIIDEVVDVCSLLKENNIATASMMFERACIDLNHLPRWYLETIKGDYALALMVAQKGRWIYLNDILSTYRIHEGGGWSMKGQLHSVMHGITFFKLILDDFDDPESILILKERLCRQYFDLSLVHLREKQWRRAMGALLSMAKVGLKISIFGQNWLKYAKVAVRSFLVDRSELRMVEFII